MFVGANPKHSDLISLSDAGQQATDRGISESCEKCHRSSAQVGFFSPPLSVTAVAGEQGRPQKSPSSALDPGDGRNHIISTVRQSHCQERASHESDGEYPEIPQMPRLSPRRENQAAILTSEVNLTVI